MACAAASKPAATIDMTQHQRSCMDMAVWRKTICQQSAARHLTVGRGLIWVERGCAGASSTGDGVQGNLSAAACRHVMPTAARLVRAASASCGRHALVTSYWVPWLDRTCAALACCLSRLCPHNQRSLPLLQRVHALGYRMRICGVWSG
jgi:hypothetical protein